MPSKNIIRLGWVSNDTTHYNLYDKEQGVIDHLIFITPFLYLFWNSPPHYWHGITQFNSKIFRYVHLCSAVHVHERSTHFCIILFDIPLKLMFMTNDETTGKTVNIYFIKIQRIWILINFFGNNGTPFFSNIFLSYSLPYYLTHKNNLTSNPNPM